VVEGLITHILKDETGRLRQIAIEPFFVCTVGEDNHVYNTVFLQLMGEKLFISVQLLLTPEQAEHLAQELIATAASARRNEPYGSGDKPRTAT